MINSDLKTEIRNKMAKGEVGIAIKMLNKINMTKSFEDSIVDEIFVKYNLTWCQLKLENIDLAKYYLNDLTTIFNDEFYSDSLQLQYHQYLWLYSDIYENEISKSEYINNFIKIYNYYLDKDDRFTHGATQKILFKNGDNDNIINFMSKLIQINGVNDRLVKDMVVDCKKYNNHVYINVIKLLEFYSEMDKAII